MGTLGYKQHFEPNESGAGASASAAAGRQTTKDLEEIKTFTETRGNVDKHADALLCGSKIRYIRYPNEGHHLYARRFWSETDMSNDRKVGEPPHESKRLVKQPAITSRCFTISAFRI